MTAHVVRLLDYLSAAQHIYHVVSAALCSLLLADSVEHLSRFHLTLHLNLRLVLSLLTPSSFGPLLLDHDDPSHTRRSSSAPRRAPTAPITTASPPPTQQPYFTQEALPSQPQESPFAPQPPASPPTSRKRKAPGSSVTGGTSSISAPELGDPPDPQDLGQPYESPIAAPAPKKSRTNTPWSPAEEQRLKTMRDAGNSWGEIAKVRPCFSLAMTILILLHVRLFPRGQKAV